MEGSGPRIQPIGGDNAGGSAQLGLAVDVGQDRNEEIDVGQGQDFEGTGRRGFREPLQDRRRVVLLAAGIEGKGNVSQDGAYLGRSAEYPMNLAADLRQQLRVEVADGRDDDAVPGGRFQAVF